MEHEETGQKMIPATHFARSLQFDVGYLQKSYSNSECTSTDFSTDREYTPLQYNYDSTSFKHISMTKLLPLSAS